MLNYIHISGCSQSIAPYSFLSSKSYYALHFFFMHIKALKSKIASTVYILVCYLFKVEYYCCAALLLCVHFS